MAAISLMICREMIDELQKLMLDLGYEPPDLDELLLWAVRNTNTHRERLRQEVETGEFAFDRC